MMFDPLSLIAGAAIFGAGYALRAVTSRRRSPTLPSATCPCGHVQAVHSPDDGTCRAEVGRDRYHLRHGGYLGKEYVPCPCRRYMGPELLRDVWTPGITEATT